MSRSHERDRACEGAIGARRRTLAMPAIEAIGGEADELRRTLRDLVALSMLPAMWLKLDARLIASSVSEVLVRMIGLEFAYVALRWEDRPAVDVARTLDRTAPDHSGTIRDALASVLREAPTGDVVTLANPLRRGQVVAVVHPIAVGQDSLLVAASRRPGFPSAAERLLLGVAANQAAIAIRQWQAEQALQLLNETLEQRVEIEVNGRMRAEKAYRQAQKMEVVGQLTGGIAHDFNNLLAAVLGNLGLLRKRLAEEPDAVRLVDGAIEGAERGKALTQRLLAFARQQDLRPVTVDVPELLRGTIEMLARSIGPSIEIRTDIAQDLWPVRVDANQLELALLNLGVNARDAMPDGGRVTLSARNETIEVGAGDTLAPGDYVCLTVADTGIGMDPATLSRATDPFFTTKGIGKGTGLGLSMVDGLAAQSGGSLRLSSSPGSGTTAELRLPCAEGRSTTRAAATDPTEALIPYTILLVDDDGLVCSTTSNTLADLGHRVFEAPSGKRALEILRSGTAVDLVLTDQAMPGMTGLQLAAEIRASWPDLPIMLTTGYADLPDRGGLNLPRLVKPYGQEEMAAAIAALMRGRTSHQ
jgi:signal transduction histidine kinase/CheY-like chemotaxis protein